MSSMIRRLGLATLTVLVLAFAGPAAPATPLQSLRLVVSVVWLDASEQVERETQSLTPPRIPQPTETIATHVPRSVAVRRFPVDRWLFQRPPPASL